MAYKFITAAKKFEGEYCTNLHKKIQERGVKFFGKKVTARINEALLEKKIFINNVELFDDPCIVDDPSNRIRLWEDHSAELYLSRVYINIAFYVKKFASNLVLSEFLVGLADIVEKCNTPLPQVKVALKYFLLSLLHVRLARANEITIRVLDEKLLSLVSPDTNKEIYYKLAKYILDNLVLLPKLDHVRYPNIEITHGVYDTVREEQFNYLKELYSASIKKIHVTFANVPDLAEPSASMDACIELMNSIYHKDISKEEIYVELDRIELKTAKKRITPLYISNFSPKLNFEPSSNYSITHTYIQANNVEDFLYPVFAETYINCSPADAFNELEGYIEVANKINLIKSYNVFLSKKGKIKKDKEEKILKIVLLNANVTTFQFTKNIRKKEKLLSSQYNRKVKIEVHYCDTAVKQLKEV